MFFKNNVVLIIFGAIILILVATFMLGFRPASGLSIVRVGTLSIEGLPQGAVIYIDEVRRIVSAGKPISASLIPGNHTIIVDAAGYYPWTDIVEISSKITTVSLPILVVKETKISDIKKEEGGAVIALTKNYSLPTKESPLVLSDKCSTFSVSNNRVVAETKNAEGCKDPSFMCQAGVCTSTIIFAPSSSITSVIPYPGRTDVLIVSYGDTVAVLEVNPLTPQYYAPVYEGKNPVVFPWSAQQLLVIDKNKASLIAL